MAVGEKRIQSIGAARSPWLGAAMFAPSVLYIVLLIGVPFALAVLYAFSDARIGSSGFHFVGLENFRSILRSPSFRKALRNSIVFTLCAQAIVIVCSNILSIALEKPFRGRGLIRFLILLPWVAPVSLGTIGWKWLLGFDLQHLHLGARRAPFLQAVQRARCGSESRTWRWPR